MTTGDSRPDAPGVSGVSFGMRKGDEARWAGKATRRKRMGSDAAKDDPMKSRIAELKTHRFTSKTHHFKRADWATIRVSGWASGWVGGRGCIV